MSDISKVGSDDEAEEVNSGGRPTDYKSEFEVQAYKLALLGATDKEMADFFHCAESTFHLWKKQHPKFSESIRAGKLPADAEVANSLHSRAKGAEWTEEVAFKVKCVEYGENGRKLREYEKIETAQVRKSAPADTAAASLWLRNRRGAKTFAGDWRDKVDHELTGKDGAALQSVVSVYLPDNGRSDN